MEVGIVKYPCEILLYVIVLNKNKTMKEYGFCFCKDYSLKNFLILLKSSKYLKSKEIIKILKFIVKQKELKFYIDKDEIKKTKIFLLKLRLGIAALKVSIVNESIS